MRKSLWIVLAVVVVAIAAPNAHGDTVTLDVSGSLFLGGGGSACSASGCTLGGDIVINNTTGAFISADVTTSGESPTVGPFTILSKIQSAGTGLTDIFFNDVAGDLLVLEISTPTGGSLIGYDGGALDPADSGMSASRVKAGWGLTSGALTPAVTAPEPSSVALLLLGAGLVFLARKRIGQRLPQAS